MKIKHFLSMSLLCVVLSFTTNGWALTSEMEKALYFLYNTQNQSGSWGNTSTSRNTEYFSSAEVLATLKAMGQSNTASYQSGSQWVKNQNVDNTAYLIHKMENKFNAGEDVAAELKTLLSYRKADGGWGGHLKHTSTNFHTAYALKLLKTINYSDQKIINGAIDYLKGTQNVDGGWGLKKGDDSTVFMAATILISLKPFDRTTSLQTAINKGAAYLVSMQNPDGSFSTKPRP